MEQRMDGHANLRLHRELAYTLEGALNHAAASPNKLTSTMRLGIQNKKL